MCQKTGPFAAWIRPEGAFTSRVILDRRALQKVDEDLVIRIRANADYLWRRYHNAPSRMEPRMEVTVLSLSPSRRSPEGSGPERLQNRGNNDVGVEYDPDHEPGRSPASRRAWRAAAISASISSIERLLAPFFAANVHDLLSQSGTRLCSKTRLAYCSAERPSAFARASRTRVWSSGRLIVSVMMRHRSPVSITDRSH